MITKLSREEYVKGMQVTVETEKGEFLGTVIGFNNEYIIVEDKYGVAGGYEVENLSFDIDETI